MYLYKEKNKFPHIVGIDAEDDVLRECSSWLTHNVGAYNRYWFCPGWKTINDRSRINNRLWPYAFKSLEHAMAFKLRWL